MVAPERLILRLPVVEYQTGKGAGRTLPGKPARWQSSESGGTQDGEDGVTGGSQAALAANQPLG
jgi:hypothetical protein